MMAELATNLLRHLQLALPNSDAGADPPRFEGSAQLSIPLYNCVLRFTVNFSPVILPFKAVFLESPTWS
jgi:hypothetical protein